MKPSGSSVTCFIALLRILLATRNAERCEHISAPKYTAIETSAKITAIHPLCMIFDAPEKSPPASMTSLIISQIYTNGTSARSALIADSTQEEYVRILCFPAYSISSEKLLFFFILLSSVPDFFLKLAKTNHPLKNIAFAGVCLD